MQRNGSGRRRIAAALIAGALVGATMVTPVGAHVTGNLSHLVRHMKKVFFTKAASDARYFTKAQSDARYQRSACPDGMVAVAAVCIDRYEATVWSAPSGGVQYGVSSDNYPCNDDGQDCKGKIFARSVPGRKPSRYISWFQAQQALANSGKRLPSNAEWQAAVAGTPGTTTCNIGAAVANTGARTGCISDWGVNDMVGNAAEWVADWAEEADNCLTWEAAYGSDLTCMGREDPGTTHLPGALVRGGHYSAVTNAGAFSIDAQLVPSTSAPSVGFRGAR